MTPRDILSNDLWIAAQAAASGLIAGLKIEKWTV